jgi:hypothetical protein
MRPLLLHLPLYIQVRFAHYLFCFEHPFFVTLSYDIIHSEHPFSTLRTSVLLVTDIRWRNKMLIPSIHSLPYEHPVNFFPNIRDRLNVNSEHPMSNTDVRNDSDETSRGRLNISPTNLVRLTFAHIATFYQVKIRNTH